MQYLARPALHQCVHGTAVLGFSDAYAIWCVHDRRLIKTLFHSCRGSYMFKMYRTTPDSTEYAVRGRGGGRRAVVGAAGPMR